MHASANSTLLALAFSSAAAGAVMIGFGIPIKEFGIGNTLICSGTTAIIGGVLLLGFASAVRQLSQQIAGLQNVRPRTQAAGGTPLSRGGVDEEAGTAALAPAHERRPTAASGGAAPMAPYTTDPATLPLPFLGDDRAPAGSGWQTPASVTDFARRRRQDVSDRDQTGPASLGREPGPEAVGLRAHAAPRTERFESIWPASKSADAHSPSRADSHAHDAQRVPGWQCGDLDP